MNGKLDNVKITITIFDEKYQKFRDIAWIP